MATQELNSETFETVISENEIVVVDFWASWCGPCKMFAPIFEEAADKHSDIVFAKVNTEEQQELAAGFGIMSIPTLMVFKEKVLVFNQPGALPQNALEELISKVRQLDMDEVRQQITEQASSKAHSN